MNTISLKGDSSTGAVLESRFRKFFSYFWGMVVHPKATIDALATEPSVGWALAAAGLGVLQVWGNISLHTLFGFDWLGTRGILLDPTFVAGFGQLRVNLEHWVPIFAALMPFTSLIGLVTLAGLAQLFSRFWKGQGSFEQMAVTMAFASAVPNILLSAANEWLFSVPMDLITGQPYWWTSAMQGKFGQPLAIVWNFYVIGVVYFGSWLWTIVLGSLAIRRIQKIPAWASAVIMLVSFLSVVFIDSIFVR